MDQILEVSVFDGGLGEINLRERAVDVPYIKNRDDFKGEGPTRWPRRFDVTNWGLLGAYQGGLRVGGAVIAFTTPDLEMLGERSDAAPLWDIRVRSDLRHSGIGSLLLRAVREWARRRGCAEIRIKTQIVNLPACHFYARMGGELESINRLAYPELPDETQMIWRLDL